MVSPLFIFLFLGLMFLGLPVLFALLLAPGIGLFVDGQSLMVTRLVSRMISGIQAGFCCHIQGCELRFMVESKARCASSHCLRI